MQFTLDKKDETFATLTVSIVEEDYKADVDAKTKEYAKTANLKGFRPGKVPVGMIRNMMGEQITAEAVSKLLSESLQGYIKDNNLALVGDALPSLEDKDLVVDWKNQKEFDFKYDLGLIPEFSFDTKLKLTEHEIEVDDAFLADTIDGLKRQFGEVANPEEVGENDFVGGEFTQEETGAAGSASFSVSQLSAREGKKVIGSKKEDTVSIDLAKAFKNDVNKLAEVTSLSPEEAGKIEGKVDFKIATIINTDNVELNDEFYGKVFAGETFESEETFLEKVRSVLAENFKKDSDFLLFQDAQKQLLESTEINFSADFFKRWLTEANKDLTSDQVEENFDGYSKELKWTLLRNKIAETKEIKVEQDEVREKASTMLQAQYLGGGEIQEEMKEMFANFTDKYLQEDNGRNYMNIFDQVLTEKVFGSIKEESTLKGKKIKIDAFKKLAQEA